MGIEEFGTRLLDTNDLDPVYVALTAQEWDNSQLHRWLVAYWMFYNAGFASYASEREGFEFGDLLTLAAENTTQCPSTHDGRWPRGRERRHFRGQQAVDAVDEFRRIYGSHPERMVEAIVAEAPNYDKLTYMVKRHRGFGPWISFKIADMTDRVLGTKVNFERQSVFMFKDPMQAAIALEFTRRQMLPWKEAITAVKLNKYSYSDMFVEITSSVEYLLNYFRDRLAPPYGDRPVNIQEVETILCKWKSHMNGHYPLGCDIHEITEGVGPWCEHSWAARDFIHTMPRGGIKLGKA